MVQIAMIPLNRQTQLPSFDSQLSPSIRLLEALCNYCYIISLIAFIIFTCSTSEICSCYEWHFYVSCFWANNKTMCMKSCKHSLNAFYNTTIRIFSLNWPVRNHSKLRWHSALRSFVEEWNVRYFRFYSHHHIKAVIF